MDVLSYVCESLLILDIVWADFLHAILRTYEIWIFSHVNLWKSVWSVNSPRSILIMINLKGNLSLPVVWNSISNIGWSLSFDLIENHVNFYESISNSLTQSNSMLPIWLCTMCEPSNSNTCLNHWIYVRSWWITTTSDL